MRRYIVGAVVIVGVGVAASLFILPSSKEIETQKSVAAEQRADAAPAIDLTKVDVEAEYNQGHRSFQVIAALADKRVAAGDRPAAIKLLEEYVAANQTDTQGRKKLAEQYQLAGRQGDYNTQLEAIAAA